MISIYETKFILIYCIVVCFILGSVFGSFLNCVADRIYHNIPWWKGRSVCDNCNHKLGILDLFPVFSYLILGGKCRYCGNKVSKKYLINKEGGKFVKTSNIIKLEKKIQLLHRKIANIRKNYLHQVTTEIVKIKPFRVVIEDLNVKGMMKNRHLSKAIANQGLYEFRRILEYKCKFKGIELILADRFFPSSKMCSKCGVIDKKLKLSDRVYKCNCGLSIDRDFNASINLSNYKLA